jgi:hypothetical protein
MRNHQEAALLFIVVTLSAAIIAIAFVIAPWPDRFWSEKEDLTPRSRSSPAEASPLAEASSGRSRERDRGRSGM